MHLNLRSTNVAALALLAVTMALQACTLDNNTPIPRRTLTTEEKTLDMQWIFSQFDQNYAPAEYKESRFNFKYSDLKQKYLAAIPATKTNEDFYMLMQQFVAQSKDAHTSSRLTRSPLPGRVQVAHIGISGSRYGDHMIVDDLFPSEKVKDAIFPLKKGDEILAIDGVSIADVAKTQMAPYRDTGNDETNLSYLIPAMLAHTSISFPMPTKDTVVITYKRGGDTRDNTLPWIVKDYAEFQKDQQEASKSAATTPSGTSAAMFELSSLFHDFFQLGMLEEQTHADLTPTIFKAIDRATSRYHFGSNFVFINDLLTGATSRTYINQALAEAKALNIPVSTLNISATSTTDELKSERNVPENALFLPEAKTYPTYIRSEQIKYVDEKNKAIDGAPSPSVNIGYMYLNTFAPEGDASDVVSEVSNTINKLQKMGVKTLIIDTLNNGGGDLQMGMQIAQLFSKTKLKMPDIQFKLSESWLDEFEAGSLAGGSDPEKELSRRVLHAMQDDQKVGKKLSRRFSLEALMPFQLQANTSLKSDMKIVILVNEMCASMCDTFATIMQDNKKATIVGSRTMGAGGNVVEHKDAPNSHLLLRQTESLMVRADGSYLENNGVTPELAIDTSNPDILKDKYSPLIDGVIELLTTVRMPTTTPTVK